LLLAGQIALADSTTDIVDALVSKGVLTEEEGKLITKGHESKKKAEGTVGFKDGFKINSGDGKSNMSINGRIQADYRTYDIPSQASGAGAATDADTFDIRRAYLTAKGTFRGWINFEATLNAGGAGSQSSTASNKLLKYYWLETAFSDQFKVRFGQFKTPMGFETQTSSRFSDMTERDWAAQLSSSINKGIMVHGAPIPGTTYQFMVSNGGISYEEGENKIETAAGADGLSYTGRLTANIAEIMGNKDAIYHVGASYGYDSDLPAIAANGLPSYATNARGMTGVKVNSSAFVNPNVTRYGLEGIVAYNNYRLASEFNNASYGDAEGTTYSSSKDVSAWYVNASWMITGEKYSGAHKNGLADRMTPLANYTGFGSSGWGAWELALRYSDLDAKDFVATTGYSNSMHSYTAGLKWIVDPNTRFLLNYIYTDFENPITGGLTLISNSATRNEKAVNFRAQFDF